MKPHRVSKHLEDQSGMKALVNNGEIWINNKTGNRYRVLEIAHHTEDPHDLVIYQSAIFQSIEILHEVSQQVWARPYDLFLAKFTKKES